jgi:hypothetical protein
VGLLLEGLDGGSFSIGDWAWKSLAVGAAYFGVSVLWRYYRADTHRSDDRSNPRL